jgi:hypothetical protein
MRILRVAAMAAATLVAAVALAAETTPPPASPERAQLEQLALGQLPEDVSLTRLFAVDLLSEPDVAARREELAARLASADAPAGEARRILELRLQILSSPVITIPNNKFLTDLTSSGNAGALDMMVPCDFWVGFDQDIREARRLVESCPVASPYVYTGKPWIVLVSQVAQPEYVAYRIRAKAYVLDTRYEKQFETDLTERVHESFQAAGVRAPLSRAAA